MMLFAMRTSANNQYTIKCRNSCRGVVTVTTPLLAGGMIFMVKLMIRILKAGFKKTRKILVVLLAYAMILLPIHYWTFSKSILGCF